VAIQRGKADRCSGSGESAVAPESGSSEAPQLLTELSVAQRSHALERFTRLQPYLEDGVPLSQLAREQKIPRRTLHRWLQAYRQHGLAGLARRSRDDRGRRFMPTELEHLIEGFALRRPPLSSAAVYRETTAVARAHGCMSQAMPPCMT